MLQPHAGTPPPENLEKAPAEISTLSGLLPTCMNCKKIRDEATGEWSSMEAYISQRSKAEFSHGICPDREHKVFNSPPDEL
ncbi:MAG: hypothetical protein ACYCX3_09315 [Thermoleophilia bacterium]